MAEYIERERLKEAFHADLQTLQSLDEHTMNLILMDIDEAPAEAVVPVVRCRECKYFREISTKRYKNLICRCVRMVKHDMDYPVKPDDFCSYGERLPKV